MYQEVGYRLLCAIWEALNTSNAPRAFWSNFSFCAKDHECLRTLDARWKREFARDGKFRVPMDIQHTIHVVFALAECRIIVSLEGHGAEKYISYCEVIQSAVDEFIAKT